MPRHRLGLAIALSVAAVSLVGWRIAVREQPASRTTSASSQRTPPAKAPTRSRHPAPLPDARTVETAHYAILSSADDADTRRVGEAVEALRKAYAEVFPGRIRDLGDAKLKLTLYANQAQFKANNHALPWAEAYYLMPICYAYFPKGEPSPYHWMLHEATHQLNAEIAKFPRVKWIEEGLGTYFGTSRFEAGRVLPGRIDPNTYPIWHLSNFRLSGDLDADIRDNRWIATETLITGIDAPYFNTNVNLYYLQYWSLTHYLFHGADGRYAEGYRRLIAEGGTLENFRKHIGPPERVDFERYRYYRALLDRYAPDESEGGEDVTPIVWTSE